MPQIRAIIWNVENLGLSNDFKGAWAQTGQFIASVANNYQADVIFIEELRSSAIDYYVLQHIQVALNGLNAPLNNWYYDWIKGSISAQGVAPFATFADLDWDAAHHEGYAVFWNQNIAKFRMTPAPPIQPPGLGATPNTQSGVVRTQIFQMVQGLPLPTPGIALTGAGIVTPAGATPYTIPVGTVGAPVGPAAAGTVLPIGTQIGPGGLTVAAPVMGANPVVVPGGFTLTDPLTLPATGAVLAPVNALSLAFFGRDCGGSTYTGDISAYVDDFVPAGGTVFDWMPFTRGGGFPAMIPGARRPAFVTLDVNRAAPNNTASDRLTPIVAYHAPAAATASASGMQRASYIQPLYQAYDWATHGWVNCNNAILGGDFNVVLDSVAYPYNAFYNGFAAGGANMLPSVYAPAPGPPPLTRADNTANKSMVRISQYMGPPIYSANAADYRTRAIDNIFYRGFAAGAAGLYDLPGAVSGAGPAIPPATVSGFLALPLMQGIQFAIANHLPYFCAPMYSGQSTIVDLLAGQMGTAPSAGNDTAARRAAEFIKLCVSDHLPSGLQVAL